MGQDVKIWRDRSSRADVFSDEIVAQFKQSAGFLSVVKPRYLNSEWCTREAHEFCQTAERTGGLVVGNKSRLFKVIKTPVDDKEYDALPAPMKETLTCTSMSKSLQCRPIHRAAGIAANVITVPDAPQALVSLALDVGLGRLALSVEGIEVLLEPLVGRDARVDRTSEAPLGRQAIRHRGVFLAMRHSPFSRRRSPRPFGGPFRDPQRRLFPAKARRSDGRSSWSPSSPWRSGTGCRKSGHSRRSPPPGS